VGRTTGARIDQQPHATSHGKEAHIMSARSSSPGTRRRTALLAVGVAAVGSLVAVPLLTAPAWAENPTAGVEVAYEGSDGYLYGYGNAVNGLLSSQHIPTHAARLAPGTSPTITAHNDGWFGVEFQSQTNQLGYIQDSPTVSGDPTILTNHPMAPGTSPSNTIYLQHQAVFEAYQAAVVPGAAGGALMAGDLAASVAVTPNYWVMPGTSPSVTTINQSYSGSNPESNATETALHGWDGYLWLHGHVNTRADFSNGSGLAMAPGTSPAIASDGNGHWKVAFQATNNDLWTINSEHQIVDTNMGMMPGTSPAITADHDGSNHYEIAFHAWDGYLWNYGDMGTARTGAGLGMGPGTSPSITALPGHTWEIAFHALGDHLWTINSAGAYADTGLLVAAGSNPAITTLWPVPAPPTTTPPPTGVKQLAVYNCLGTPDFDADPPRTISLWARDVTAGGDFARQGSIGTDWQGMNCNGQPFVYAPPITGHVYQIEAVDFDNDGCTDDPHGSCVVLEPFAFTADTAHGVGEPITVG
jgi:hypothetical protein